MLKKIQPWQADLLLLAISFIWGTTFIIVKQALEGITPFTFLALRFSIAFFSLLLLVRPRKTLPDAKRLLAGLAIGFCLFCGYAFQTIGLQYTSATNAGFITGLSVVFVPLLGIFYDRRLPNVFALTGAVAAAVGLGFLTLDQTLAPHKGDLLVLFCAVAFAFHIIYVGKYAGKYEALQLALVQIGTTAVFCTAFSLLLPGESWPACWPREVWTALAVTAIPATSLALLIQNSAQRFTSPARTAIIFTTEPIFSALTSWYIGKETLAPQALFGAGLILFGILLAELKGS